MFILFIFFLFIILFIFFYTFSKNSSIKILNLILYSETSLEYISMYKLLSRYLKQMKVQYYFYAYDPNIDEDYIIKDDIIYMKGEESLVPGCLEKTLKVFEICRELDFEYVLRTNISQIVNFKLLENILSETDIEYGGGTHLYLTWLDEMSGIIDNRYWNTNFIRGNAIIFNRKIFDLILDGKTELLSYNIVDDVAFGVFLKNKVKNIVFIGEQINLSYDENAVFYRNKHLDRKIDVNNMKNIIYNLIFQYS